MDEWYLTYFVIASHNSGVKFFAVLGTTRTDSSRRDIAFQRFGFAGQFGQPVFDYIAD